MKVINNTQSLSRGLVVRIWPQIVKFDWVAISSPISSPHLVSSGIALDLRLSTLSLMLVLALPTRVSVSGLCLCVCVCVFVVLCLFPVWMMGVLITGKHIT